MEKKRIVVKDTECIFLYDEDLNMWRMIENLTLIHGYSIDLEVDLKNFTNPLDWANVKLFIGKIIDNNLLYKERIKDAQNVLRSLFQSINKSYDQEFINSVEFVLSGIDFKGNCEVVNMEERFIYDLFFFPQYSEDPYCDIGSFVWRANFRDTLLLGVYCDRI